MTSSGLSLFRPDFAGTCSSRPSRGSSSTAKQRLELYGAKRSSFATVERKFERVLLGFDPQRVAKKYDGKVDTLLADLLKARGLTSAQAKRQSSTQRAGFPLYARGVLTGAKYFCRFENGTTFADFVSKWMTDLDVTQMLPQYFEAQKIPGFGAALAADFLKELGVKELGKPDRYGRDPIRLRITLR